MMVEVIRIPLEAVREMEIMLPFCMDDEDKMLNQIEHIMNLYHLPFDCPYAFYQFYVEFSCKDGLTHH